MTECDMFRYLFGGCFLLIALFMLGWLLFDIKSYRNGLPDVGPAPPCKEPIPDFTSSTGRSIKGIKMP